MSDYRLKLYDPPDSAGIGALRFADYWFDFAAGRTLVEATPSLPRLRFNSTGLCDQKNLLPVLGAVRGNDHERSLDSLPIVQVFWHKSTDRQEPALVGYAGLQNAAFRKQHMVQNLVAWEVGSTFAWK